MQQTDIIILAMPKLKTTGPLLSLGQLKAVLTHAGITSFVGDFNIWLYNKTKDTVHSNIWDILDNTLTDETLIRENQDFLVPLMQEYIKTHILPRQPKVVGVTAFSFWTFPIIKEFLTELRKVYDGKILLGGPALTSKQEQNVAFTNDLLSAGLVNDFISGDAELSLIAYMNGEVDFPGINNYQYNNNFDRNLIPFTNYDDFDFNEYAKPILYVSGSRGCVRKCAFCNVPLLWDKFLTKNGTRIADEIIHLVERHNIITFRFTDSLINGNQKNFILMLQQLADYNSTAIEKIEWSGQFIIRETRALTSELFDLMQQSGCDTLFVGVESGSEKVRREIGKPFSNAAIEYHLHELSRVNINVAPLMFVGFPTETDDDFQQTMDILDMFHKYSCVTEVGSEHPMLVIPGTPVHNNMLQYGIIEHDDYFKWTSVHNTYQTRIERFFRFMEKAIRFGLHDKIHTGISNVFIDDYLKMPNQKPDILDIIRQFKDI